MDKNVLLTEIIQHLNDSVDLNLDPKDSRVETQNLKYDLGLDSIDLAQFMSFCTDELHVDISDEEFEKAQTIGKVVDLLYSKLKWKLKSFRYKVLCFVPFFCFIVEFWK